MKYTYLLILLMLFGMGSLVAQTTVSIENKVTAPAASVPVQVSMLNFSSVGSVTLEIAFDSEVLSFQGIDNITGVPAGSWFANAGTNKIVVQFTTPNNYIGYPMNGHVFDLKFGYLGGFNSNLTISSVEVTNEFFAPIPVVITNNGSVTQSAALATVNLGSDQPAASGNPVTVPLNMATAQEFSSFIYKISFDPAKLSFVQILNQGVNGSITAPAPVNGVLTLTWNGTSYPSGYTGKVCDLKFVYNGGGDAPLTFKPGSQIVKSNTQVLATNYSNGKVVLGSYTSTLSLPTLTTDINAVVTAPVDFVFGDEALTDIGAFNLKIGYDNTKLAYQGFTYGTIPSGVTISAVGGVLTVVWSNSANAIPFGGTLLNLKFKNIGTGTSALTFNAGTTVTQVNLSNVAVTTTNGSVVSNWLVSPATKTVIVGDPSFTFSVTTSGLEVFKWQVKLLGVGSWIDLSNNATYSGVASNILTITGATTGMSTNTYQCVNVTTGLTTTNFAVLTVNPLTATITDQPDDITVNLGANPTFTVTATGGTSFIWWYKPYLGSWTLLTIAPPYGVSTVGTTSTLTITGALAAMNGSQYRCSILPGAPVVSYEATLTVNPLIVNVKVILQGALQLGTMAMPMRTDLNSILPTSQPYNVAPWNYTPTPPVTATIPNADVVDWILVELRSTASGAAIANGRQVGFLLKDGSLVGLSGSGPLAFPLVEEGNYFIVVKHRNHLAIMSSAFYTLNSVSGLYDFTVLGAYGTNGMATIPGGKFAMWGGDVNNDNIVRYNGADNDRLAILNAVGTSPVSGYLQADINMNGNARYNGADNDRLAIINNTGSAGAIISGQLP